MSIIIEIEDDEVFRLYHYYHKVCFPSWKEGDIHEVNGIEERRKCRECQEWIEAEQEMQALDHALSSEDEEIECRCGQLVRADRLPEHSCPPDPAGEMRALENNRTWKAYLRGELD